MLIRAKLSDCFGSTESTRVDGKSVSALVTWDSKVLTVVALLGGVGGFARRKMKKDGIYDEFLAITKREYGRVLKSIQGEDVGLCLPKASVPDAGLKDFTQCST
ncbi:hypothetical protein E4U53_007411 [Claviceps sorghi]|nr:hypothetical protein E4U53_007411 [Claviceps sorghi]